MLEMMKMRKEQENQLRTKNLSSMAKLSALPTTRCVKRRTQVNLQDIYVARRFLRTRMMAPIVVNGFLVKWSVVWTPDIGRIGGDKEAAVVEEGGKK
ncbi:hypothetical protein U1Q18_049353 [Sarracenia purpurea var. burkii]